MRLYGELSKKNEGFLEGAALGEAEGQLGSLKKGHLWGEGQVPRTEALESGCHLEVLGAEQLGYITHPLFSIFPLSR